jgi:hypothetical protein
MATTAEKVGWGALRMQLCFARNSVSRQNFTEYLILRDLGNAFAEAERELLLSSVVVEYMLGTA